MSESPTETYATRHGPMLALRGDEYITRSLAVYGEYCPDELNVLLQLIRPGMTVIEVGANIGTHSVPMAKACAPGPFYAFEPQHRVFQILCANLAMSDVTNALAYPEASGAQAGHAMLPVMDYGAQSNFGGVSLRSIEAPAGERSVRVTPIDDLPLESCGLIKIDVEGWEAEVLKGAAATIARFRPRLYVENDRPERQQELISLIDGFGYRMYWHAPPLFSAANFNGVSENVLGRVVSLNMLCVPRESATVMGGATEIDPDDWASPLAPRA